MIKKIVLGFVIATIFVACGSETTDKSTDTVEEKPESNLSNNDNLTDAELIIQRHNYYRNLEFTDSNLSWDEDLAEHSQNWANYLALNYKASDATNGLSPHASVYQKDKHSEDDFSEGENIAWSSNARGYLTDKPIDISDVDVANSLVPGSVDAWASEKAYYSYEANALKSGYENEQIGHYTQLAWQKTTKVGCAKAMSTTDRGGEWVVCRYSKPGNLVGAKPYCSNYTLSDLYTNSILTFTLDMIKDKTFSLTKILENRTECSRVDISDSSLIFSSDDSASISQYNAFNSADSSNLWNMSFDDISVIAGELLLTNNANDRYMKLKLIGEDKISYNVEAEWWVTESKYSRSAILKLAK